jgi:hypothetical protein
MNAPAAKPSPTLEDATDEEVLDEVELRGIGPDEKDTGDFSDNEIRQEFEARFGLNESHEAALTRMVDELYRSRAQVPDVVKDFIYEATGRTLP